jgi:3-phosphoshikimate 1-carboxyvinyltransferase
LFGTDTLNKRPIAPLVEALNALGGDVRYTEVEGQAPLLVKGKKIKGGSCHMGHVESSQFITALMLISPKMVEGLHLTWDSVPSQPYLVMTAALLREAGFKVLLTSKEFRIEPGQMPKRVELFMERDWSAVAFWCEVVALAEDAEIELVGFKEESLQGDSRVLDYFEPLGVKSQFKNDSLFLSKKSVLDLGKFTANLISEPDLAQALITTLLLRKTPFEIHGLQTLKRKETDRIGALVDLAEKLGVAVRATKDSLICEGYPEHLQLAENIFDSLEDHRVAMSLAPVSLKFPLSINRPEVVEKSYPEFWGHFAQL